MAEKKRRKSDLAFYLNPILRETGMSKRKLAKLTEIQQPMLCRLAKPATANPTWETVMKLCVALDCTPDAFLKKPKEGAT